jgi:hypothetical protein
LKHDPERDLQNTPEGVTQSFPYQFEVAIATAHNTVLVVPPTSAGKTLVLAMLLLYHRSKVSIVISPLETDQPYHLNATKEFHHHHQTGWSQSGPSLVATFRSFFSPAQLPGQKK